jgi:DNA repair protein RAD5
MKTPDGLALVPLPPRTIDIEEIELSANEQEVYDWIYQRAKRTFNANIAAGTLLKSYTTIFAQLLRLRQACCDPTLTRNKEILADEEEAAAAADVANGLADDMDLRELIERFSAEDAEQDANKFGAHVLKQIQDEVDLECPICAEEPMVDPVVSSCWHSACKQCLLDYIEHQKDKHELPRCFNCREPINQRDLFAVVRHEDTPPPSSPTLSEPHREDLYSDAPQEQRITLRRVGSTGSAKVVALLTHLKRLRRGDPSAKCVVFSQFTSFLDIVQNALSREHISCLRFDGTTSQKQRAAVLQQFALPNGSRGNSSSREGSHAKGVGVLLLSLRAGGVGLNLTMAREVFVLDPWWSWAVESQAIDRVHRMGQEMAVRVTRFIVRGSVEERMLKVQERKKFMYVCLARMIQRKLTLVVQARLVWSVRKNARCNASRISRSC